MRFLFVILFFLASAIQYPLWLGKGGWLKNWELERKFIKQRAANEGLRARNAALEAEVRNLQIGTDAIEEKARDELGMMRKGEIFVQILSKNKKVHAPLLPHAAKF